MIPAVSVINISKAWNDFAMTLQNQKNNKKVVLFLEISLEKIELVKDRTGVSYKEAKEALEKADGNVVDAIIYIEETIDTKNKFKFANEKDVLEKLKEFVKKGNVSKIIFKKDDEIILNIPVNAGVIGFALAPWAAIAGTAAALVSKCKIEIVKDDGEIIDFNEISNGKLDDLKSKADEVMDEVKKKSENAFKSVKNKMNDKKDKEPDQEAEEEEEDDDDEDI